MDAGGGGVQRRGTLYHAGSILRRRSPDNNDPRDLGEDGYTRGTTHVVGIEAARPTLRAYSTPHFLHSALFPPKYRALRVEKPQVEVSNNTTGGITSMRERVHSRNGGRRKHETSREPEEMDKPCQHGRGGYLHRYKGFEQEQISCPPVVTFRVLGGLGESRRRRANSAPAGKARRNNEKNVSPSPAKGGDLRASIRPVTACHTDSGYGLFEETPGSLTVEFSHESSTEKETGSSAYPLNLFAEGSRVEPVSAPPDEGVTATPAWFPGSKIRPRGVKRQASWAGSGAAQQRKPPLNKTASRKVKVQRHGAAVGSRSASSRAARRFGSAARSSAYSCEMRSSAFLPYSLERPVSTERTQAFFFTSN